MQTIRKNVLVDLPLRCEPFALVHKFEARGQVLAMLCLFFIIPTIFMTFAYISVGLALYRSIQESKGLTGGTGDQR